MRGRGFAVVIGLIVLGAVAATSALAQPMPQEAVRIWTAPLHPQPGQPLEIFAVATDGALDELRLTDPSGQEQRLQALADGGPPWVSTAPCFVPRRAGIVWSRCAMATASLRLSLRSAADTVNAAAVNGI